ncbi:DUF1642 domain-containing protein [Tetragenococcus halophilus]|uniref:DUF1642 domain-containing protein n=1 Tax=Tetragenococcus halophilus TaxID=51669 RepID=A0A3G5FII0_TETHA|nr:DUF1642 domain-containing protein [Tetragenococcus halophilus]AYW50163.1 DUF1642 domain-containing protein [Tetragenococcus halophilus]GBD63755.1 hypothetical protein TEHD23766T_1182 [Tetragenococcus halophilus subsp. flandriensis]
MDKQELIEFLDGEIRSVKENISFKEGMNWCAQLVERYLDLNEEPEITAQQAWEKIAEEFEEGPKELCATLVSALPPYNLSEQPEIPKFMADWIRGFRILDVTDLDIIGLYFSKEIEKKCEQWITDNFNDFIKALVNGYTEKAPVWVALKDAQYFHAFTGEYDKFEGFEYVLSMYEGNAHTFADKQKAEAVATLVDGTVKEWSE